MAGHTEIHERTMKDSIMTMRHLPDGHHLMLLDLKRPLKQGESFAGTLTFGKVEVEYGVESLGASGSAHH